MSRKKILLTRIKDIGPHVAEKEINLKAIVMESNSKEDQPQASGEAMTTSGSQASSINATLLVGDETGCISLVIPQYFAQHIRVGDIIQFYQVQVVMKKSRIYLWSASGKLERVGEFTMLFKEAYNVSNLSWTKDVNNGDVWVPNRHPIKRANPLARAS
uniref:Uncharacterized protein AlNc14C41G3533 n=1 Tax=Albugo laibachii Nc14 TaxID=890382 RepID=F0W9S9_9STRA|nr:conserved hypothetical protein [Albugo laibachii Nc14]|eukprot:CCA17897.1 conserved hypothetical protein [Albugo laibachii Nc14]